MLHNIAYILAPCLGFALAQGIKYVLALRLDGMQWSDFTASGGMPSSHTATAVSLVTLIGVREGIYSPLFALGLLVAMIIMYDAVGVRRTTGENTLAIRELEKHTKITLKQKIHLSRGHENTEVIAGAILGILIGLALGLL